MISLRFDKVAQITGGTLYNSATATRAFTGVSIDSREVKPGEMFIALRGRKHDAHEFIPQVLNKGVSGVLVEYTYPGLHNIAGDVAVVAVHDAHEAMMVLARSYRNSVSTKFVGITGSNGKTTTKEFTYRLLTAVELDVYRSPGNLNNLYGMPLAIFAMPSNSTVAVMEMGISVPGEMARLAKIVAPDLAVVTNVGATHLEFLGSLSGVAKEKLQIVSASPAETPLIINADNGVLVEEASRRRQGRLITFGITAPADVHPDSISYGPEGETIVKIAGSTFRLPLFGAHQVYNLLAAFALVQTLGYSLTEADTLAIDLDTAPMRGQRVHSRNAHFILDCYNANPESMKLGLGSFDAQQGTGRRIIILGDMLELGTDAKKYHREIGEQLAGLSFDRAILVGPLAKEIYHTAQSSGVKNDRLQYFPTATAAAEALRHFFAPNDLVYLKGSRGIGLEKIFTAWDQPKENA